SSSGGSGGPPGLLSEIMLTRTTYATRSVAVALPVSVRFGDPVTVTVTVSWPVPPSNSGNTTPAGNVTFREDGTAVGTNVLTGGVAMMTMSDLTPGAHSFRADYSDTLPVPNSQPSSALPAMVTVGLPGHSADLAFGGAGGHVRVLQFDQQVVA